MLLVTGIVLVAAAMAGLIILHAFFGLMYLALALGIALMIWHGAVRRSRRRHGI